MVRCHTAGIVDGIGMAMEMVPSTGDGSCLGRSLMDHLIPTALRYTPRDQARRD